MLNNVIPKRSLDLELRPKWTQRFEEISGEGLEKYLAGQRGTEALFTNEQAQFLASIGSTPQELYDFIEDWLQYGEPSFMMALRIMEVRAEYFLLEQNGQRSPKIVAPGFIPSEECVLGGFVWLPRIIAKAKAKLRGELPVDLMFGCRKDLAFLKRVGIDPAEFLRVVWRAGSNDEQILEYVKISAQCQGDLIGMNP